MDVLKRFGRHRAGEVLVGRIPAATVAELFWKREGDRRDQLLWC